MRTTFIRTAGVTLALALVAAVSGCDTGPQPGGAEKVTANLVDLGSAHYNPDATHGVNGCTVGGTTMHCCPSGQAMIGARLDSNVFKCANIVRTLIGAPFADTSTVRDNMHACPFGSVMIGFHQDLNILACQQVQGITGEEVDSTSTDGWPMHVCDNTYDYVASAMSGIRVDQNKFLCATDPVVF